MKHILTIAFISTCLFSFGQSHMFWNNYANFNPAMSGFEYEQHANATYINYWPALSGNYSGVYANYGMRLGEKHGVGINYTGDFNSYMTNKVLVNYNYQFDLKNAGKLAPGIGIGAGRSELREKYYGYYSFPIPEPQNTFELTLGVAYSWKKLMAGVSTTNLTPYKPATSSIQGKFVGFNAHISYDVALGEKFKLTPRVLFTSYRGFQNLALNTTAMFDERFALGVSFRGNDNFGFNLGWDIQRKFRVAYSFNQTFSKLNNGVSGGIHEFSIGYLLKN